MSLAFVLLLGATVLCAFALGIRPFGRTATIFTALLIVTELFLGLAIAGFDPSDFNFVAQCLVALTSYFDGYVFSRTLAACLPEGTFHN
jgi:hypothetical protein